MAHEIAYDVRCGIDTVQVRKHGSRQWRQGKILGREPLPEGRQRVWVDRLLVPPGSMRLSEAWTSEGAISTVLDGPIEQGTTEPGLAELPG